MLNMRLGIESRSFPCQIPNGIDGANLWCTSKQAAHGKPKLFLEESTDLRACRLRIKSALPKLYGPSMDDVEVGAM